VIIEEEDPQPGLKILGFVDSCELPLILLMTSAERRSKRETDD
jgi:hypothetical protein